VRTLLSDIEIAQEATMLPIKEVAAKIGLQEDDLELYGKYKAKINKKLLLIYIIIMKAEKMAFNIEKIK